MGHKTNANGRAIASSKSQRKKARPSAAEYMKKCVEAGAEDGNKLSGGGGGLIICGIGPGPMTREHRTEQFARHLKLMHDRAHKEAEGSCFIIFDTRRPDGGQAGGSKKRYIQFSFESDSFCLDMPLETLDRTEGEEILRTRQGFFYLRDRPEFTLHGEDVEGHDPFRKLYAYGDEDAAAGDMTHIFYELWKLSVDSPIFVRAASFNGKCEWEAGSPIE
jgi:hypothetical protein